MMKIKWVIILSILSIVLLTCLMVGPLMSNVEQPNYQVIKSEQDFDIREYIPMITAEVKVQGERDEAIGKGFRILADYIFGNNTIQQKITMTASAEHISNEKIAMTAPVQQQSQNGIWKISFVMPSKYQMHTLPKPNNVSVMINQVPKKRYVVTKFSGWNSNENIEQHEKLLMKYIKENHIKTFGLPTYAFYNPPWTLPFMRRNEIMFEIENISKN